MSNEKKEQMELCEGGERNFEMIWISKEEYDNLKKENKLWYRLWLQERYDRVLGLHK